MHLAFVWKLTPSAGHHQGNEGVQACESGPCQEPWRGEDVLLISLWGAHWHGIPIPRTQVKLIRWSHPLISESDLKERFAVHFTLEVAFGGRSILHLLLGAAVRAAVPSALMV